jgi:hypothetical protein
MNRAIRCMVCLAVLATAATWSGSAAAAPSIHLGYYTPQFYMEYLVFYDQAGNPYYYVGDTSNWVPVEFEGYDALVAHYRHHAPAYHRWYAETGQFNLYYRRPVASAGYAPLYYLGYPVFYDDLGRPIYYVDGAVVYVPTRHPRYRVFIHHYRHNPHRYRRWYRTHGRRFPRHRRHRVHRAPPRHRAPPVAHHPRHRRGPHHPPPPPGHVERRHHRRHPGHAPPRPGRRPGPAAGRVDCRRHPDHPACRRRGAAPGPRPHRPRGHGAAPGPRPHRPRGHGAAPAPRPHGPRGHGGHPRRPAPRGHRRHR